MEDDGREAPDGAGGDGAGPDRPDPRRTDAGGDGSSGWLTSPDLVVRVEDVIYAAVAVVLVILAAAVLVAGGTDFVTTALAGDLRDGALQLLDGVLLVLMLVELLHTVGISIRENVLAPEPFLIVGLIAAVRRILIITAEQSSPTAAQATGFRLAMLELGLLTLLIAGLVGGIIALSRWRRPEQSQPPD